MAQRMGIEVVEDEALRQQRIQRELAKVQAEFMMD